ncbi:MAG: YkgJ family cysteine cluster protein [Fretibacterium sp.]|nr:YkgJ family cysteine cluster protein [Fretibacterium sp.]
MSRWWEEGLRFHCLGCGRCCRGEPGAIFFTPEEARRIAGYLGISRAELRRQITMRWGRPSFRERPNGDCVFYDADSARCSIYPVRPSQCRSFPFWPETLRSRAEWDRYAARCPGMNEGPLLSPAEITEWVCRAESWTYLQNHSS